MRDQLGQRLLDLRAQQAGVVLQVGEEAGAMRAQHLEHLRAALPDSAASSTAVAPAACCQWGSASRSHSSTGVPRIGPSCAAASPLSVGRHHATRPTAQSLSSMDGT